MRFGQHGGRWVLAAAGAMPLAAATPAHAAKLKWSSPSDCERAGVVEARIEELAGRSLATLDEPNFEVRVARAGDTWQLTLVTEAAGRTSRRGLSGRSCIEVTDAAAVAMAMAIRASVPEDSERGEPNPAAETSPGPATSEPPASNVPPLSEPGNPEPSARAPRLGGVVGIAALLDTAALPAPTLGVGLAGGARWAWLRVELQGAAFAPRAVTLTEGRSGEFALLSGALLGCIEPTTPGVAVFGCSGLELGRLSGEGRGVSDPELGTALWTAARLEVGAGLPVSPALRFAARLGVAVPFERPEFVLVGEPAHRPAALSVRAALGVDFLW